MLLTVTCMYAGYSVHVALLCINGYLHATHVLITGGVHRFYIGFF
jgi:hypothetical protein